MQTPAPIAKQSQSFVALASGLIGEVVRSTREGIDGRNMRAQTFWEQPGRDGKIFVMGFREPLARCVGLTQLARTVYQGVSVVPARWFAALAIVNSRSDNRLT